MVFRHSTLAILKDTCTCLVCLFCWRWAYPLTSACFCRGSWCTGHTDAAAAAAARALAPDKSYTTSPQSTLNHLSQTQPPPHTQHQTPLSCCTTQSTLLQQIFFSMLVVCWNLIPNEIPAYNPCWDDRFGLVATVAAIRSNSISNRSSRDGSLCSIESCTLI